jgi:hypothetical protein
MSWFRLTKLVTTSYLFVRLTIISVLLDIKYTIGNRTYTPTAFSKDEILQNHASCLNTLNIPGHVDDDYKLSYLYWILKLHKTSYKQRFIAGSKSVLQNICRYPLQKY